MIFIEILIVGQSSEFETTLVNLFFSFFLGNFFLISLCKGNTKIKRIKDTTSIATQDPNRKARCQPKMTNGKKHPNLNYQNTSKPQNPTLKPKSQRKPTRNHRAPTTVDKTYTNQKQKTYSKTHLL